MTVFAETGSPSKETEHWCHARYFLLFLLTLHLCQGGVLIPTPAWQAKSLKLGKVNSCFLHGKSKRSHSCHRSFPSGLK